MEFYKLLVNNKNDMIYLVCNTKIFSFFLNVV